MVMLALLVVFAQVPPPAVSGERSLVSKCDVSADAEYGYTKDKPIRVGGSPLYGASRQRRYLQALIGPAGQPIAFKRRGSLAPNRDDVIIDHYEVTYAGLDKPIELYLDFYRWEPPKAPQGFLCGTEIGLAPPPPDPFVMHRTLMAVAIERSAVDSLPPIPIEAARPERGMVFDGLRVVTLAAREIVRKGGTPTDRELVKVPSDMVVVANPLVCGGDTVEAEGIGLVAGQRQIQGRGPLLSGNALRDLLPGIELPKGAVGAMFGVPAPPMNSAIAIKYRGTACGETPPTFAMRFAMPRRVTTAEAVMPAGIDTANYFGNPTVKVRFAIGPDGRTSDLSIVSGEARLADAALEAVRQWRYDLPTVNGLPVFAPVVLTADVPIVRR